MFTSRARRADDGRYQTTKMAWTVKYCQPFGAVFRESRVFTNSRLTFVALSISRLLAIRVFRSAFGFSVIGPFWAWVPPS
jgi:hypothetical protein